MAQRFAASPRKIGRLRKNAQFRGTRGSGKKARRGLSIAFLARVRAFGGAQRRLVIILGPDNLRDPRIAHVFNRLSAKNPVHGLSLGTRARAYGKPVSRATYDVGPQKMLLRCYTLVS